MFLAVSQYGLLDLFEGAALAKPLLGDLARYVAERVARRGPARASVAAASVLLEPGRMLWE